MTEIARAKVNLALHVTALRDDGYHLLDSLVTFTEFGDHLDCTAADAFSLQITGPFSKALAPSASNLVTDAARRFARDGVSVTLDKHIPIAAGLGGGSCDAAATLRMLSNFWDEDLPKDEGLSLGADVPVCLYQRPAIMRGIGEELTPLPDMPAFPILLVNPGKAVSTADVFRNLTQKENAPLDPVPISASIEDWIAYLAQQRNDLERPACDVLPEISQVLDALSTAPLARMTGSGATCFALFQTDEARDRLAAEIKARHPNWWVMPTRTLAGK